MRGRPAGGGCPGGFRLRLDFLELEFKYELIARENVVGKLRRSGAQHFQLLELVWDPAGRQRW